MMTLIMMSLQMAFAGAEVSNFKKDTRRGANFWNAGSAIDENPETAWMVSGESENIGEWITIDAPNGTSSLDKVSMIVGYAADEESFFDYSRVKQIRIDVYEYNKSLELEQTTKSVVVNFEDTMEKQVIDIDELKVESSSGGKFRLNITEVYPGKDYTSVAISEVKLLLTESEGPLNLAGATGTVEGSDELNLTDKSTKSQWIAENNSTFTLSGKISSIGLQSVSSAYARPKKVKVSTGGRELIHELPNTSKVNWVLVPTVTGYTGSNWDDVKVEILEVYPGSKGQLAISEVKTRATVFSAF